jgi:hypothetical protein
VQVITAAEPEWIAPFTGLTLSQFATLVGRVAVRGGVEVADGRPGRQWSLQLGDRVLLVAVYWRTNLTMCQIGPLFGVSHTAAHRVIDSLGPLLALTPIRRRRADQIAIVDGTLMPPRSPVGGAVEELLPNGFVKPPEWLPRCGSQAATASGGAGW